MIIDYRFGNASGLSVHGFYALGYRFDREYRHPDFLESFILGFQGDGPPVIMQSSSDCYLDIWQSPGGRVFVSSIEGAVLRNDDPRTAPEAWTRDNFDVTLDGLCGVSEDLVFTWEVDSRQVFAFDGRAWNPMPPLPERIRAMHGVRPDLLVATGYGFASHWDGSSWRPIGVPDLIYRGVHVESEDEIYLVTQDGQLVEASLYGGQFLAESEDGDVLLDVVKFRDEIYVATEDSTLLRRVGASLSPLEQEMPSFDLDARAQLMVATEEAIYWSDDASRFRAVWASRFSERFDGQPPGWDPDADMDLVVDLALLK